MTSSSLLLPALAPLNTSSLSGFSALDFTECDRFYAYPAAPTLTDCFDALDSLPQGSQPVTWYTDRRSGQPNILPLVRTNGTCQIVIQASGQYAETHPVEIQASPDDLSRAASLAIHRCVAAYHEGPYQHLGGYSTLDFAKVVNWITAPSTVFPGNLELPESITFLTAMVWNSEPNPPDIEPGSEDEWAAAEIRESLEAAANHAPEDSYLRLDLEARAKWVEGSELRINSHGGPDGGLAWWVGPKAGAALGTAANSTGTGAEGCGSSGVLANATNAANCSFLYTDSVSTE